MVVHPGRAWGVRVYEGHEGGQGRSHQMSVSDQTTAGATMGALSQRLGHSFSAQAVLKQGGGTRDGQHQSGAGASGDRGGLGRYRTPQSAWGEGEQAAAPAVCPQAQVAVLHHLIGAAEPDQLLGTALRPIFPGPGASRPGCRHLCPQPLVPGGEIVPAVSLTGHFGRVGQPGTSWQVDRGRSLSCFGSPLGAALLRRAGPERGCSSADNASAPWRPSAGLAAAP